MFASILSISLLATSCFFVQEVEAVNRIFFPKVSAVVNEDAKEDGCVISFEKDNSIVFKGWFWEEKEITNHAVSKRDILLRVKDSTGKMIKIYMLHKGKVRLYQS